MPVLRNNTSQNAMVLLRSMFRWKMVRNMKSTCGVSPWTADISILQILTSMGCCFSTAELVFVMDVKIIQPLTHCRIDDTPCPNSGQDARGQ